MQNASAESKCSSVWQGAVLKDLIVGDVDKCKLREILPRLFNRKVPAYWKITHSCFSPFIFVDFITQDIEIEREKLKMKK